MKEIFYSRQAQKTLSRIPANEAKRIVGKIQADAATPESQANNVKALKGSSFLRLRVGNLRIIMDDQGRVLMIVQIGPRGGIYD